MKALNPEEKKTVTCIYKGTQIEIPIEVFLSEVFNYTLEEKKYVRYHDGAKIFSMSQSEFNILAHDAEAIYKRGKMSLIKLDVVEKYLEYFRIFDDQ